MLRVIERVCRIRIGHQVNAGSERFANGTHVFHVCARLDLDLDLAVARVVRGTRAVDQFVWIGLNSYRNARRDAITSAAEQTLKWNTELARHQVPASHLDR